LGFLGFNVRRPNRAVETRNLSKGVVRTLQKTDRQTDRRICQGNDGVVFIRLRPVKGAHCTLHCQIGNQAMSQFTYLLIRFVWLSRKQRRWYASEYHLL